MYTRSFDFLLCIASPLTTRCRLGGPKDHIARPKSWSAYQGQIITGNGLYKRITKILQLIFYFWGRESTSAWAISELKPSEDQYILPHQFLRCSSSLRFRESRDLLCLGMRNTDFESTESQAFHWRKPFLLNPAMKVYKITLYFVINSQLV